jgi:hypothetical protein
MKKMKISVSRSLPVFVSKCVESIQKSAVMFVVAVLGLAFVIAGSTQLEGATIQSISFGIGGVLVLAYWISLYIDAYLHAKDTYIEIADGQVAGKKSGFTTSRFTASVKKISTMYVQQSFVDKLFGVSAIVFTQQNSLVSVYGLEEKDAQDFARYFAKIQEK